jgi:hypothetical protein
VWSLICWASFVSPPLPPKNMILVTAPLPSPPAGAAGAASYGAYGTAAYGAAAYGAAYGAAAAYGDGAAAELLLMVVLLLLMVRADEHAGSNKSACFFQRVEMQTTALGCLVGTIQHLLWFGRGRGRG